MPPHSAAGYSLIATQRPIRLSPQLRLASAIGHCRRYADGIALLPHMPKPSADAGYCHCWYIDYCLVAGYTLRHYRWYKIFRHCHCHNIDADTAAIIIAASWCCHYQFIITSLLIPFFTCHAFSSLADTDAFITSHCHTLIDAIYYAMISFTYAIASTIAVIAYVITSLLLILTITVIDNISPIRHDKIITYGHWLIRFHYAFLLCHLFSFLAIDYCLPHFSSLRWSRHIRCHYAAISATVWAFRLRLLLIFIFSHIAICFLITPDIVIIRHYWWPLLPLIAYYAIITAWLLLLAIDWLLFAGFLIFLFYWYWLLFLSSLLVIFAMIHCQFTPFSFLHCLSSLLLFIYFQLSRHFHWWLISWPVMIRLLGHHDAIAIIANSHY